MISTMILHAYLDVERGGVPIPWDIPDVENLLALNWARSRSI